MPSRWDSATRRWRRRVFHYPPPTLMSRNFRLPCAIELQPLSLTPLKMRKVELGASVLTDARLATYPHQTGVVRFRPNGINKPTDSLMILPPWPTRHA